MARDDAEGRVRVNGAWREHAGGTIADLCRELGVDLERRGVAVAMNEEIVPRARWETTTVRAGDEIEIVGATQGG